MNSSLPKQIKLIPISEAAKILGVSIDTVRRWDKSGILHSERPDGKNRYFSQAELEKHKIGQPLTISEAAKELNISTTTLRRLEARNLIKPIRNSAGERVYTKDLLDEFLNSHYFLRQKGVQKEENEPQPPIKLERPNLKPRSIMPYFLAITTALFLLLVTIAVSNIKLYDAKSPKLSALGIHTAVSTTISPKPTAAEKISVTPTASVIPTASATPAATLTPSPVVEEKKAKVMLRVKINEASASASINIYQKPTDSSEEIGQAKNGDIFELVSIDSIWWYEVKLASGSAPIESESTGFISAIYLELMEEINE